MEVWGERETEKQGILRSGCGLHCRDVTGDGAGAGVRGEQTEEESSWQSWDPDCLDREQTPLQILAENKRKVGQQLEMEEEI